jgi:hypothetical protein
MSVNVNDVYQIVLYAINKNQNGYLDSDEFNRLINLAQNSYVSFLLGSLQTYQAGRPIAKVELGQNSVVRQRLSPVIYGYILNVDVNGNSPYPLDYFQTDSMWSIYGYKRIRYVDQDRWFSTYNSVIDPIANYPIYMLKDTGFEFAPTTIGQAKMSYVRNPPPIQWGFDLDVNGRRVYSPANSNDPIWDEISILEIIVRCLSLVGLNLQINQVMAYSQEIKNQGQ